MPERLRTANQQAAAALKAGKPILVSGPAEASLQEELRWMGEPSCVSFPILREGQSWGVIQLMKSQEFCEDEAVLAATPVQNTSSTRPLGRDSRRTIGAAPDPGSSGVVSSTAFETKLDWELECVLWGGRSCTILRIRFHPPLPEAANGALRQARVLRAIRQCLRPTDLISPESSGPVREIASPSKTWRIFCKE